MNDNLPTLHDKANNALVWLLSERVSGVFSGAGHIGQTAESSTGSTPVPADEAKEADAPGHSGRSEIGGVGK